MKNANYTPKLDSHGKKIRNPEYDKYVEKWGKPSKDDNGNWINQSLPKKVILDEGNNIQFKGGK